MHASANLFVANSILKTRTRHRSKITTGSYTSEPVIRPGLEIQTSEDKCAGSQAMVTLTITLMICVNTGKLQKAVGIHMNATTVKAFERHVK